MDSTDISSHNLRHTYITRCAESGINPMVLKKLVGHKDIETTLGIYTTVYDNFTKSEMNKIQSYYKRNKLQIGEISRLKSNNWLKNTRIKEMKNKVRIFIYQIEKGFNYLITSKRIFNKNLKKSVPCLMTRDTDSFPTGRGARTL
jgi:hypothetical protein